MDIGIYQKIGFKDRQDNKPNTYKIDGVPKEILKDNTGLVESGTALNAENFEHIEDGILQNSRNVSALNNMVQENSTKIGEVDSNVESVKSDLADKATKEYVDSNLENTKGTISAETDTGEVSTPYTRQVNASLKSTASSSRSQVNASNESTASGSNSQVNCSAQSTASGSDSQVNASYKSTASKDYSQVNASSDSTASGYQSQVNASDESTASAKRSQVNCSLGVINDKEYTLVGGYGGTSSTKNIKWEISSKEGTIKSSGAITGNSTFADFAEYFESVDGKAIPTGTIVTLQENKIRPCQENEEMLGVISETAGILLNASGFCWQDRYVRNEFGGLIYEEVLDKETEQYITVPKENPNHDIEEDYIPREDREEWNIVGLTGQVYVKCDDTAKTGGFIKSGNNGIATKNEKPSYVRWKVMKITTPYDKEKGYGVALVFIR